MPYATTMKYLTAEQIAAACDDLEGVANIRAINKLYREQDESHLYPVNGKFNATERAIRRVRRLAQANGPLYGLEYAYCIESVLSNIVNGVI